MSFWAGSPMRGHASVARVQIPAPHSHVHPALYCPLLSPLTLHLRSLHNILATQIVFCNPGTYVRCPLLAPTRRQPICSDVTCEEHHNTSDARQTRRYQSTSGYTSVAEHRPVFSHTVSRNKVYRSPHSGTHARSNNALFPRGRPTILVDPLPRWSSCEPKCPQPDFHCIKTTFQTKVSKKIQKLWIPLKDSSDQILWRRYPDTEHLLIGFSSDWMKLAWCSVLSTSHWNHIWVVFFSGCF